ncbi:hypothetical protein DH2020_005365 [Rehmannia glutinosa]|uniref:No apical meristem-associated C-terminal domain-containing protein n=1 Tax=Rehmannia glutinosa TaxID=99300 RepID=A0ABR0XFW4_REHGL
MASNSRSVSYSHEEDQHLCHIYLDVSQNPIIGINQSKDHFWSRIEENYNTSKPYTTMQERIKRSLQCRMQVIMHAVGKLRGCIRQIEHFNPSGASEQDILNRARELLMQDKKYKKEFKFDHVWPLLKDMEKFTTTDGGNSSHDDNVDVSASQRPIGVKKAKLKRKQDDSILAVANAIRDEAQQLVGLLSNKSTDRQQNYDIERKRLYLLEQQEESKFLLKDLDSISDPKIREYFRNEQLKIWQKRVQKEQLRSDNPSSPLGQYFQDLGGSGSDLPDY